MNKFFTKAVLLTYLVLGVRLFSMATIHSVSVSAGYDANAGITGKAVVKDLKTTATLNAYPNPSRGLATIVLSQPADEAYKISISNAIGKVIKTIAVANPADGMEFKIDLSEMPSGFYFYSLSVNDKMIETKRLVIQH